MFIGIFNGFTAYSIGISQAIRSDSGEWSHESDITPITAGNTIPYDVKYNGIYVIWWYPGSGSTEFGYVLVTKALIDAGLGSLDIYDISVGGMPHASYASWRALCTPHVSVGKDAIGNSRPPLDAVPAEVEGKNWPEPPIFNLNNWFSQYSIGVSQAYYWGNGVWDHFSHVEIVPAGKWAQFRVKYSGIYLTWWLPGSGSTEFGYTFVTGDMRYENQLFYLDVFDISAGRMPWATYASWRALEKPH